MSLTGYTAEVVRLVTDADQEAILDNFVIVGATDIVWGFSSGLVGNTGSVDIGDTYDSIESFEEDFYTANTEGASAGATMLYGAGDGTPAGTAVTWQAPQEIGDIEAGVAALATAIGGTDVDALTQIDALTRLAFPDVTGAGYAMCVIPQSTQFLNALSEQQENQLNMAELGFPTLVDEFQFSSEGTVNWAGSSKMVVILLTPPAPVSSTAYVTQLAALVAYQHNPSGGLGPTGQGSGAKFPLTNASPSRQRAWTFTLDGHTFYVLDLGTEGTFLWDQVTNQWCKFLGAGNAQWNLCNGTMWGTQIVGADLLNDNVYTLDPTTTLDEGWRDILHVVTGGITSRARTYISCDAVRLAASFGLLDELNGTTINLRFSDNQEETWSAYYKIAVTEGDFGGEIAWRSLGSFMAPGRIFEISSSGGLIRIDGCDAFLDGFDNEEQGGQGG